MKYILIAILFVSCMNQNDTAKQPAGRTAFTTSCDSLNYMVDSLKKKLFVANFKVERVRYYLDIVDKKPSQSKFLKGWVRRAVDEQK